MNAFLAKKENNNTKNSAKKANKNAANKAAKNTLKQAINNVKGAVQKLTNVASKITL